MKKKNILNTTFGLARLPFKTKRRRLVGLGLILAILSLIGFAFFFVLKDIPRATVIGRNTFPQASKLYDRNGKLLFTIYTDKNQTFVSLDKIPIELQQATIATEDRNFYKHGAIDIRGITRAAYSTIFKKELQGGSTITQQLVKNSILTFERTVQRKIKEILLSFVVEAIYSKDQILEMYLNQVSYGGTAWGVEAASQVYFNKEVADLTLSQSAFIAALPEAPSLYSPFGSHPEQGRVRQLEVLRKMREQGYITEKQQKKAGEEELKFSEIGDTILAPHFVFYVKDLLSQEYGPKAVEQGGLSVTTTLDLNIQKIVEDAIATEGATLSDNNRYNAAAMVTDPSTGEILAMVGSRNYFDTENDGNVNVTIAKRQPGSSIKPINYAAGLINGYTAATPFVDEKICFPNPTGNGYCPLNYDREFHGVQQMRYALANSYNIPAVKMLKVNTVESMIDVATSMGITTFTDPERYGLSLTLGGGEVMMTDMTEAFGVFANNGYRIPIIPILKVVDSKGKTLNEYTPPKSPLLGKKVIPEGVAFIISNILSDNNARAAAFGTNSLLRIPGFSVAVKTGTTNDFRDNWTIGYTPSYVAAAWVGNNDNTPLRGVSSGLTGATPIWNDIMTGLLEDTSPQEFQKPNNVLGKNICSTSGLLPQEEGTPGRCPTRFEYFIKGTIPTDSDPGVQNVLIDNATQDLAKEGQTENVESKPHVVVTDPTGDSYCITCPRPEKEKQE